MGITAAVREAIANLHAAFISGAISEKKFRRREERLLSVPRGEWAEPVRRPAAPSSGSRQNRRRDKFQAMFAEVSKHWPAEPRRARRNMARQFMRHEGALQRAMAAVA